MTDTGPAIGWKFSTWSRPEVPCACCSDPITAGRIRVDAPDPGAPGFAALCTACAFKIDAGQDPDLTATKPGWAP